MSKERLDKIRANLQELASLVKEEALEESKELTEEINKGLKQVRQSLAGAEGTSKSALDDVQDNLNDLVQELEAKALKVQYKLQEKFSEGQERKDELVVKTSDALIEAINKVKATLISTEKK